MKHEGKRHPERIEVRVDYIQVGTTLSGSVYDKEGNLLYRSHVPFTREMIADLKNLGISLIFYTPENGAPKGDASPHIEQFRGEAQEISAMLQSALSLNTSPDIDRMFTLAEELFQFIELERISFIQLLGMNYFTEYVYTHPFNVAFLSMMLSHKLGIDRDRALQIGVGGILHNVGQFAVSDDILRKKEKLSDDEMSIIKRHAASGYDFMKQFWDVPEDVLSIISQHHERYDGSGYPEALKGDEISDSAMIAAVCDVYDAMISEKPYKRAFRPGEAIISIMKGSSLLFSPAIAGRFFREMTPLLTDEPVFPPETLVLLSTGEVALVREVRFIADDRPLVTIITDRNKRKLDRPYSVDLTMDKTRSIDNVVRYPYGAVMES